MGKSETLASYLEKIGRVYELEHFAAKPVDRAAVVEYYTQSSPGYGFFHSGSGSVHMALCRDGRFSRDGYYEHARLIDRQLQTTRARRVLELASGKGFNSVYLARRNPDTVFTGIDLTPAHVAQARKRARRARLHNIRFQLGDFHALEFPVQSFDYIFAIESLCHALDLRAVLAQIQRLLKPGGVLSVFDGFAKQPVQSLNEQQRLAALLVEKSMAVGKPFPSIDTFVGMAQSEGFELEAQEDFSAAIMPNLYRLQFFARGYYKFPRFARLLNRVLPPYLVQNSIAGLLMPRVVGDGIRGYFHLSLRRAS